MANVATWFSKTHFLIAPGGFRLFLAFVVVIHHSFPLRMGGWAVGLFFVLSGYWISRMWRERYSGLESPYFTFLISRWWRLAPIFFAVHVLALLFALLGRSLDEPIVLERLSWWITQPLIIGSTQFGRLLPPAWSLDVEMQFYALAPAILAMLNFRNVLWTRLGLFLLLAWSVARLQLGASIEAAQLDLYLWLFLAGSCAERFDWRPSKRVQVCSVASVALLILGALLLPEWRSVVWLRGAEGVSAGWRNDVFFVATTILALPVAIGTVKRRSGSRDRWLGDLSYPLYLFHWLPREVYYGMVDWAQPAWRNLALLLANWASAFVGAALLLIVIDRPLQKFRQGWVSGRKAIPKATDLAGLVMSGDHGT